MNWSSINSNFFPIGEADNKKQKVSLQNFNPPGTDVNSEVLGPIGDKVTVSMTRFNW